MTHVRVSVLVLLVAAGCSPGAGGDGRPAAQSCDAPGRPKLQAGEHLIGDREPPVPYSSIPPTSGWHSSGAFEIAIQPADDPLTEPEQVSVLEAGGVVVAHHDIPDSDRTALVGRVARRYSGRVAVTPHTKLAAGQIAFTGDGVLQRCNGLDLEELDAFVAAHADARPNNPGEQ